MIVKLWSVPLPLAATWSNASEPHASHIGRGGWRSFWQSLQRWIGSTPSFDTAFHHQALSCPIGGFTRVGAAGCDAPPVSVAAGCGASFGMNLSTRKVSQPTGSPCWSYQSVRVVMK